MLGPSTWAIASSKIFHTFVYSHSLILDLNRSLEIKLSQGEMQAAVELTMHLENIESIDGSFAMRCHSGGSLFRGRTSKNIEAQVVAYDPSQELGV